MFVLKENVFLCVCLYVYICICKYGLWLWCCYESKIYDVCCFFGYIALSPQKASARLCIYISTCEYVCVRIILSVFFFGSMEYAYDFIRE